MALFLCLFVFLLGNTVINASQKACNVFGDPNIITFDGELTVNVIIQLQTVIYTLLC